MPLTVARVAPKNTTLLAAVVLKLAPVIVTVATTTLVSGVNKVMEGTCAFTDLFNKKLKAKITRTTFLKTRRLFTTKYFYGIY